MEKGKGLRVRKGGNRGIAMVEKGLRGGKEVRVKGWKKGKG